MREADTLRAVYKSDYNQKELVMGRKERNEERRVDKTEMRTF